MFHPNSPGVTEVQGLATYELGAIVSNNVIGNFEPVDNVLDEFSRPLGLEVDNGPDLDPLGELVDGD
jgi:hypothetical protein